MSATQTVLVLAGGAPVDPHRVGPLPEHGLVIAADSGLAQAAPLGVTVDLIVGDLDSVDATAVAAAVAAGATVERHPADKDATDLDLALRAARRAGARRVIVVGGAGGRLDHLLGNALLLGADHLAGVDVEWRSGENRVYAVRRRTAIPGTPGDLVTLLAVGGPAGGVTTSGLRWALDAADLSPGSTRGISNEMTGEAATVSVQSGVLLAIHTRQP